MRIGTTAQFVGGEKLPYDAEVEYLESSGGQFINTGIVLYSDDIVTLNFSKSSENNKGIFGVYVSSENGCCIWDDGSYGIRCNNPNKTGIGSVSSSGNTIIISGRTVINNGVHYESSGSFNCSSYPAFLFTMNRGASTYNKCSMKLFSFVVDNKADMIPVRVGSVGYMYDRVSNQLFGNVGTGAFIVGPDVSAANGGGISGNA